MIWNKKYVIVFLTLCMCGIGVYHYLIDSWNTLKIIDSIKVEESFISYRNERFSFKKYQLPKDDYILDWVITKRSKDAVESVWILIGKESETYGYRVEVLDISKDNELVCSLKKRFKNMNPWALIPGDVNGDGILEMGITMYKTTRFHPVFADRPFVYTWKLNEIVPLWRGSRLAHPFKMYLYYDVNNDGYDNLVSLEYLKDMKLVLHVYEWKEFGFESLILSEPQYNIENIFIEGNELVTYVGKTRVLIEYADTHEIQYLMKEAIK